MVKLVSYRQLNESVTRIGALINKVYVLDLAAANKQTKLFEQQHLKDMLSFIAIGDSGAHQVSNLVKEIESGKISSLQNSILGLDQVKLTAPIPVPRRNLMCVGKNYKDHIAEVAKADKAHGIGTTSIPSPELPKYPQFFTKATNTVIGHLDSVQAHSTLTKWLDYEAELAVIIGKPGKDITVDQAMSHVYGFTIANDITARDVQRQHNQWFKGKSLDTTCPMGPYLVHKDTEGLDPFNLKVQLWLNQIQRQDGNTNNMIFNIPTIIQYLSAGMTLESGDILLTGTPDGVGYARKPPIVLQPGDHMAIEIDHLGRLENTVV
jgi:2-keto-4-pentenoate hydratase/2-oxohepta-3-ene-1,7-dioic acid hydratase in catechol pathway